VFNLNAIKEQFQTVISYSQGIDNPQVDELFDKWLEAKRDFIEAMNGELIFEYPEKITLPLAQKERDIKIDEFISILDTRWDNNDLATFVHKMREGFFNNLTPADYQYGDILIKKGTKLVRAFKYFETDKSALTDIQNHASRIIQEDKIEGILCVSVHPLDYLSTSENTYNWRSCHALDGEYRSGNLSYMVDKSTVICYLKSDKEETLPNFPFEWNSKKWRVLIYFSNDWNMIMAGRQYPFMPASGLDCITKTLLPAAGISRNSSWTKWHTELLDEMVFNDDSGMAFTFNDTYVPVGGKLVPMSELVQDRKGSLQFNDLLRSSCYSPMYAYRVLKENWWFTPATGQSDPDITRFFIGGEVPCMRCGQTHIVVNESMQCVSCEEQHGTTESDDFGYCVCCSRHVYLEDAYYVEDEIVCDQCYDNETSTCDLCGDRVFNSEISYDRESEQYICVYCKDGR
jgi:hypothetical protein